VIERGAKDGYNTAVVEFLRDEIPSDQQLEGIGNLILVRIFHFHISEATSSD
jgi:hypothetical protein